MPVRIYKKGVRRVDGAGDSPSRPLVVSMSMLTLVPGGMGGTETYARELLREYAERSDVEVQTFVSQAAVGWRGHDPRESSLRRVRGGESTVHRLASLASARTPGAGKRVGVGAHMVHYPFTVPAPRVRGVPSVVTLHDVQHLDLPDFFSRAERELRRFTYDRAAQRADLVVTVSEFCKTRIHDLLDIPFDRIRVARLGVSPFFHPDRVPKEDFVIYPARRDPHKNHERLLEAMHRVRDQYPGLRLVLTGGGPDLPQVPDWVEQRGQVSVEELRSLYQRAQCMVFPSLYEGFGMPPLEAMASGCQIAVSTAGSLPEVCGDVGVTFNPKSVTDIARGIETALASPERDGLRGLDHARGLTWGACAEKHVEAFRSVVKRGPV